MLGTWLCLKKMDVHRWMTGWIGPATYPLFFQDVSDCNEARTGPMRSGSSGTRQAWDWETPTVEVLGISGPFHPLLRNASKSSWFILKNGKFRWLVVWNIFSSPVLGYIGNNHPNRGVGILAHKVHIQSFPGGSIKKWPRVQMALQKTGQEQNDWSQHWWDDKWEPRREDRGSQGVLEHRY